MSSPHPTWSLRTIAPAALLAVAVGLALHWLGGLSGLEQSTVNTRFSLRSTSAPKGVAIVAIDPRTFAALQLRWPFPRSVDGDMIDRLHQDGAAEIVYDVQFTTPTTPAQDQSLYQAVARAPGTVLATSQEGPHGQTDILGGNANLAAIGALPASSNLISDDGVIDRFPFDTGQLDSLAVVAVQHDTGHAVSPTAFSGRGALIDYRGGPASFPTYSFSDVLDGKVNPSGLRGRIVVVGVTDPSLHDVYATPTSGSELMSGAEIWANAIWTTLHGIPLDDASSPLAIICILLLALVAPLARLRWRAPGVAVAAVVAAVVYLGLTWLVFDAGLVLPIVAPLVALAVGTVAILVTGSVIDGRERERVSHQNELLEERVAERTHELRDSQLEIIRRLAQAVEQRDFETGRHLESIGHLTHELALAVGLDPGEAELLRHASMLHDVGKVGIPDRILLKQGPLQDRERAIVNQHTVIGSEILSDSPSALVRMAETIARSHHERWDGSGYPDGLRGEEIPLVGRICAVCDVYDALLAERPYKAAWTRERALGEIASQRGRHFDPAVVDAFLRLRGAATERGDEGRDVSSGRAQANGAAAAVGDPSDGPAVR